MMPGNQLKLIQNSLRFVLFFVTRFILTSLPPSVCFVTRILQSIFKLLPSSNQFEILPIHSILMTMHHSLIKHVKFLFRQWLQCWYEYLSVE